MGQRTSDGRAMTAWAQIEALTGEPLWLWETLRQHAPAAVLEDVLKVVVRNPATVSTDREIRRAYANNEDEAISQGARIDALEHDLGYDERPGAPTRIWYEIGALKENAVTTLGSMRQLDRGLGRIAKNVQDLARDVAKLKKGGE